MIVTSEQGFQLRDVLYSAIQGIDALPWLLEDHRGPMGTEEGANSCRAVASCIAGIEADMKQLRRILAEINIEGEEV